MALTAAQQEEVNKLKEFLAKQDLSVRQNYQAMFATNGSFFFNLFKELDQMVENIEKA